MFEFIIGKIVSLNTDFVVIQNNGIGYRVYTSSNSMSNFKIGMDNQLLYTQLILREDNATIIGFSNENEMDMFNLLLMVSKIGPKIALGILSALTPNQIKVAILNKNIDELTKCPGIGKKTAERMIVELKDRIDPNSIITLEENATALNNEYNESIQALISLGYTKYEVENVLRNMDIGNMDLETIIKEALKRLSKG